jgi:hypothetical protein
MNQYVAQANKLQEEVAASERDIASPRGWVTSLVNTREGPVQAVERGMNQPTKQTNKPRKEIEASENRTNRGLTLCGDQRMSNDKEEQGKEDRGLRSYFSICRHGTISYAVFSSLKDLICKSRPESFEEFWTDSQTAKFILDRDIPAIADN